MCYDKAYHSRNAVGCMHIEAIAKNLYINFAALASTFGLSLVSITKFFDGILPTVSLLLSSIAVAALIYYHLRNAGRANAERRLADLRADLLEIELAKARTEVENVNNSD